jgi:hypothetical protein
VSQAAALGDPHLLEGDDGGQHRGQQIRHSDRPAPALACQFPLGLQRSLPVFVLGRQVLNSSASARVLIPAVWA